MKKIIFNILIIILTTIITNCFTLEINDKNEPEEFLPAYLTETERRNYPRFFDNTRKVEKTPSGNINFPAEFAC